MKKVVLYSVFLTILWSCEGLNSSNKNIEAPSGVENSNFETNNLVFEKKNYYTDLKLAYPQILLNGKTNNPINTGVEELIEWIKKEYSGNKLDEKKEVVDNYLKDNKLSKNENTSKFTVHLDYQVSETPNYFSLLITIYEFGLGAHGNTTRQAFNYSKKLEKLVTLGEVIDLSAPEKEKELQSILSKSIDTEYCEVPIISKDYELFIVNLYELGIAFNDYDLGAYTCGSESIFIKNKTLKQQNLILSRENV